MSKGYSKQEQTGRLMEKGETLGTISRLIEETFLRFQVSELKTNKYSCPGLWNVDGIECKINCVENRRFILEKRFGI